MNLRQSLKQKRNKLILYFTAGYPALSDLPDILDLINQANSSKTISLIELGLPFSDSLVDGPVIQEANSQALGNGMSLQLLLDQLSSRTPAPGEIPLLLMSSFNPIMQYGVEKFVVAAKHAGILAALLPDLPPNIYERDYQKLFEEHDFKISFLVTERTSAERISYLDGLATAFLYVVSSEATTGSSNIMDQNSLQFVNKIAEAKPKNALLVGFGVDSADKFIAVNQMADGAIIGSDFIRQLKKHYPANREAIGDYLSQFA